MNWKRHFAELASLAAAAVLCAVVANALASPARKLPLLKEPRRSPEAAAPAAATPGAPVSAAPKTSPEDQLRARFPAHGQPWKEIKGEDVEILHARGALFLDARYEKIYAEGHVAGARSFPVWQPGLLKPRVEELVAEGRDPALPIVIYCSGGDCEDSHMLGEQLFGAGFTNLLVYKDGFPDWQKRGGKVETGVP